MADSPGLVPLDGSVASPTSRRGLGAHSAAYVAGTAIQGIGVLLVLPFATRLLGAAEFGRVATGLVTVQLVGTIAAAGLPQVVLREYHRGSDGPQAARALAGTMAVGAAALGVLGVIAVLVLSAAGRADRGEWVPVVTSAAALAIVVSGQTLSRARMRPLGFLTLAIVSTVLANLAGLLAARAEASAARYLTAYAAVLAAAAAISLAVGRPLPPWAAPQRVRAGLRLAAPLLPQALAMLCLLMGDVLLARLLLGEAAAGEYQVALQLGNMPFVLAVAFFNAWGPLVLSHPMRERWAWTARTGLAITTVVAIGAAGVAALAPWLVEIVTSRDFDRVPIAGALALVTIVSGVYMVYQGSSLAVLDAERTGVLAWAALTAVVVLLVLSLWWAPRAGDSGVVAIAAAKVLAYVVLMGLTAAGSRRLSTLSWPRGLWALLGALCLVATGCAVATSHEASQVPRLVLAALLAVLAVASAPRVLRALRG